MKIKQINEIVDANDDLIGANDIPTNGSDLESQANNTTDYNVKTGQQPFRYDMLGRFGFTLLPFMEGVDRNEGQTELLDDISDDLFEFYKEILEYYYRNPNVIKSDFRKLSKEGDDNIDLISDSIKNIFGKQSEKIIKIIEKHFENAFEKSETLDESKVDEDKMVDKIDKEFSVKSDNADIQDAKLKKIAGLINKLDKDNKRKIKNLLETE